MSRRFATGHGPRPATSGRGSDERLGDQVVAFRRDDLAGHEVARAQMVPFHPGDAVNIGGIGVGAAEPEVLSLGRWGIDQDVQTSGPRAHG